MLFVLLGLGSMGYAQSYITESLSNILCAMEAMEASLWEEQTETAKKAYDTCYTEYTRLLNHLTLFMNHNELTNARVTMGRLGVCIADENWNDARASYTEAKLILTDVAEQERIKIKNIF